ncbi:hypothetical protein GCK32_005366 [Trichostrongylus colubriformis]|uniref:Uncharacterized protein n=1 Tax=Trichostrongylus colubriformis TaxID=6319 RepID=A0AAN8EY78_TRICO
MMLALKYLKGKALILLLDSGGVPQGPPNRSSAGACPLLVVGQVCPQENPLYYFKCCGDLNASCCFRLQDWVLVLLLVLAVSIVLSIIVNIIRCLCCY